MLPARETALRSARWSPIAARTTASRVSGSSYVDGFVVPVPTKNLAAYRRMSRLSGKVWREHGALAYTECVADDVKPGKYTSFPQSVKLKRGETVGAVKPAELGNPGFVIRQQVDLAHSGE